MDVIRLSCVITYEGFHECSTGTPKVLLRKPKLKGFFEPFLNVLFDVFLSPSFNYTIEGSDIVGSQDSNGTFSGCNGKIQRNESDAGLYIYNYPSHESTIDVSNVISEEHISIASTYNMTKPIRDMSVLDSFSSLSWVVWITFMVFSLLMALFLKKMSLKLRRKNIFDIVSSHVFHQGTFPFRRWYCKVLSLTLSMLAFFILLYYNSVFTTDIVVVEKPPLIQNYDDIIYRLDKGLTPKFMKNHEAIIYHFKKAEQGRKEKTIWQRIQGRDIYTSPSIRTRMLQFKAGKSPEIHTSNNAKMMSGIYCMFKVDKNFVSYLKGTLPWIATDPTSRKIQRGFVLRRGVNQKFKKHVLLKATQVQQHGLYDYGIEQMVDVERLVDPLARNVYRVCNSGILQMPEVDFAPFAMKNFWQLFYLFVLIVSGISVVLVIEVLISKIK